MVFSVSSPESVALAPICVPEGVGVAVVLRAGVVDVARSTQGSSDELWRGRPRDQAVGWP